MSARDKYQLLPYDVDGMHVDMLDVGTGESDVWDELCYPGVVLVRGVQHAGSEKLSEVISRPKSSLCKVFRAAIPKEGLMHSIVVYGDDKSQTPTRLWSKHDTTTIPNACHIMFAVVRAPAQRRKDCTVAIRIKGLETAPSVVTLQEEDVLLWDPFTVNIVHEQMLEATRPFTLGEVQYEISPAKVSSNKSAKTPKKLTRKRARDNNDHADAHCAVRYTRRRACV